MERKNLYWSQINIFKYRGPLRSLSWVSLVTPSLICRVLMVPLNDESRKAKLYWYVRGGDISKASVHRRLYYTYINGLYVYMFLVS